MINYYTYSALLPCERYIVDKLNKSNIPEANEFIYNCCVNEFSGEDIKLRCDLSIEGLCTELYLGSTLNDINTYKKEVVEQADFVDVGCVEYYKRYDPSATLCKVCPHSNSYVNDNYEFEKEVLIYVLKTEENYDYVNSLLGNKYSFRALDVVVDKNYYDLIALHDSLYKWFFPGSLQSNRDNWMEDSTSSVISKKYIYEKYDEYVKAEALNKEKVAEIINSELLLTKDKPIKKKSRRKKPSEQNLKDNLLEDYFAQFIEIEKDSPNKTSTSNIEVAEGNKNTQRKNNAPEKISGGEQKGKNKTDTCKKRILGNDVPEDNCDNQLLKQESPDKENKNLSSDKTVARNDTDNETDTFPVVDFSKINVGIVHVASKNKLAYMENCILSDGILIMECVLDQEGKETFLFFSKSARIFFYFTISYIDALKVVYSYISRKSFLIITYKSYYLYTQLQKYKMPSRSIVSLATMERIMSRSKKVSLSGEDLISKYSDTTNEYGKEQYIYMMPYYEQVYYKLLDRAEHKNKITKLSTAFYLDEIYGRSYELNSVVDSKCNLFKFVDNNIIYNYQDDMKSKQDTFKKICFVYELAKENENIHMYNFVESILAECVDKGIYRKYQFVLLTKQENGFTIACSKESYSYWEETFLILGKRIAYNNYGNISIKTDITISDL